MTAHEDLHAIPIPDRPKQRPTLLGVAFILTFNTGCFLANGSQLLLWPLALIAPKLYRTAIRRTKANFGLLLGELEIVLPRKLVNNMLALRSAHVSMVRADEPRGNMRGRQWD